MSEKIVQLNEEVIKSQIKELVRGSCRTCLLYTSVFLFGFAFGEGRDNAVFFCFYQHKCQQ